MRASSICLAASIMLAGAGAAGAAEPVNYKGKTVTLIVGSATGGGLDLYGRLISRHLGKHIPGTPSVVLSYMPGAGSNVAALHIYAQAPKDGTVMATVFPSVLVEPLLNSSLRKDYDPTKFAYIGNANPERPTCLVRNDSGMTTPEDFYTKEIVLGASAGGSPTFDNPTVTKALLGLKLKVVAGYKGAREVTIAMERNEVQGMCGFGWSTVKSTYPDILSGKLFVRVFAQEDVDGNPELNAVGIPSMMTIVKTEEQREILRLHYVQNLFSRPFILPPGVDPNALATMRAAFLDTLKDPELLAEADKAATGISPSTGEAVAEIIKNMYATPPEMVDKLRKLLGRSAG